MSREVVRPWVCPQEGATGLQVIGVYKEAEWAQGSFPTRS